MIGFLFSVIHLDSLNCPTYSCDKFNKPICAKITSEGSIAINSEQCPDGLYCDFIAVDSWSSKAKIGKHFKCHKEYRTSWFYDMMRNIYTHEFNATDIAPDKLFLRKIEEESKVYFDCGHRDLNARYEGDDLIKCDSNTDCIMLNGKTGTCTCGLDGYSYCRRELDDAIYETYWEICEKHEGRIDHEMAELWYWTSFLNVQMKTAPECTLDIFGDFATINSMNEYISSSEFIRMSSALLTIVLLLL